VVRLRDRGFALEVRDLFECQTVAKLAALHAKGAGSVVTPAVTSTSLEPTSRFATVELEADEIEGFLGLGEGGP